MVTSAESGSAAAYWQAGSWKTRSTTVSGASGSVSWRGVIVTVAVVTSSAKNTVPSEFREKSSLREAVPSTSYWTESASEVSPVRVKVTVPVFAVPPGVAGSAANGSVAVSEISTGAHWMRERITGRQPAGAPLSQVASTRSSPR